MTDQEPMIRFDQRDYDTFLIMAALRVLLSHNGIPSDSVVMTEMERRMRKLGKEQMTE